MAAGGVMVSDSGNRWADGVCEELRVVRRILSSPAPDTYEQCRPRLERAISLLEEFEQAVRQAPEAARMAGRGEVEEIRRQVRLVAELVRGAAAFYQGLGQVLAQAVGYTPGGGSGGWRLNSSLTMEG